MEVINRLKIHHQKYNLEGAGTVYLTQPGSGVRSEKNIRIARVVFIVLNHKNINKYEHVNQLNGLMQYGKKA